MTSRRSRFTPSFEGLETKLPPTGGITLAHGVLSIVAPMQSGNTASVSIDGANGNVEVILDGITQEFAAAQVSQIMYQSGAGGGDRYVNFTGILSLDIGLGGHNTFTGGTGQDVMFLYGDGNVAHRTGGFTLAFTHGGHDTIDPGILIFN